MQHPVVSLALVILTVPARRGDAFLHQQPLQFPCVVGARNTATGALSAASTITSDAISTSTATAKQLGLITFDLDDTLFPTSETVRDANQAQLAHMNAILLQDDNDATILSVADFLQTTREIRQDLERAVTYTELRKMAIRQSFLDRGLPATVGLDLEQAVDQAFDVWLDERHKAAERHIFADSVSSLQRLKERFPDVCIAAITNGRGNPLDMTETISQYFDFCVSGEDDGVFPNRKPHAGIYDVALQRYRELYPHHNHQQQQQDDCSSSQQQRIWVHVGDCLANDVGASAECGAFAVWYYPDGGAEETSLATAASRFQSGNEPSYSTASKADIAKRQQLADQAEEKVAIRISSLSELEFAIEELLAAPPLALPIEEEG